jgi:hypothetical protein
LHMTMVNEIRPDYSIVDSLRTQDDKTKDRPLHAGTFFAFMDADQIQKEAPIIKRCWKKQELNTPQAIMQSLKTNITWRYEMMDSLRGALLYQTDHLGGRSATPWKELFEFAHNELYGPEQTDAELLDVLDQRNRLTQEKLEENWRVLKDILRRRKNKQGGPKSSGSKKPTDINQELLVDELMSAYTTSAAAAAAKAAAAKAAKAAKTRKANRDAESAGLASMRMQREEQTYIQNEARVDRLAGRVSSDSLAESVRSDRSRSRDKLDYGEKGGTRRKRRPHKPKRTRRVRKSSKSSRKAKTRRRVKK